MPSTSGQSSWRTQSGGRNASEWLEITPSSGQWHSGNYIYDKSGLIRIAGSNDCTSLDYAVTWTCRDAWDPSGIDTAIRARDCTVWLEAEKFLQQYLVGHTSVLMEANHFHQQEHLLVPFLFVPFKCFQQQVLPIHFSLLLVEISFQLKEEFTRAMTVEFNGNSTLT